MLASIFFRSESHFGAESYFFFTMAAQDVSGNTLCDDDDEEDGNDNEDADGNDDDDEEDAVVVAAGGLRQDLPTLEDEDDDGNDDGNNDEEENDDFWSLTFTWGICFSGESVAKNTFFVSPSLSTAFFASCTGPWPATVDEDAADSFDRSQKTSLHRLS